ncbi:hypothetical protein [Umezawaea beigongshangensis]|nr:hypothetical protein [Umezawaea beigongshangensis]
MQAAGATFHRGIEGGPDLESIHPRVRRATALSAVARTAVFYRLDF